MGPQQFTDDVLGVASLDANGRVTPDLVSQAAALIRENHACYIRNFPTDPDVYTRFLATFGSPLPNYSSRSDLEKTDPHPAINRVKYKARDASSPHSVHHIDGALRPHTARSWCAPRPKYFSMLMVDPGWTDGGPEESGTSLVLSWNHLLSTLDRRGPAEFAEHYERLSSTNFEFRANNVREPVSSSPVIYPLEDPDDSYDVGVRIKQDLLDKVEMYRECIPEYESYKHSLSYLINAADEVALQARFAMGRGDLLILDNNRYAHGRSGIVGWKTVEGRTLTNPRELWSVTIGN